MPPKTFPLLFILVDVRPHIAFTDRWLRAHPLTQGLPITGVFHTLVDDCQATQQKEFELDDKVAEVTVAASILDMELNVFAQRVSNAVLVLTGGNRAHDLYLHFFGDKPLHLFVKPVLGNQLTAMRKWIPSLTGSEHPSLKTLGEELPALIQKAEDAATAVEDAEQARTDFREVGERRQFIDKVNALRKETYGILSTLPHKHTGLPSNFADQFFLRDRSRKGEEATVESLEEELNDLKKEISEKEAQLNELKQARDEANQKAAADEAARAAAKLELAEVVKELAEKQKKISALKATIATGSPQT
jgi:hypothetical protein